LELSHPDVAAHAAGYGIPGVIVDGQDVLAVREVALAAVERAREGKGPTLIEAKTYRFRGHCGATTPHQNPEECEQWKQRDPILLFERYLLGEQILKEEDLQQVRVAVEQELAEAERFALDSPLPSPDLLRDLEC